jgi:3-mercaptopyruvate sulfurtransferase SseA
MKQTAVDWLEEFLKDRYTLMDSEAIFQHAKQKEKHQISMAHLEGAMKMHYKEYQSGDEYYKENYENK